MDCFSLNSGVIRAVLRLGKKEFLQSALVPLNRLNARFSGKEQSELKRMTILNIERQLFDVSTQYLTLCLLQHWSVLIFKSQPSAQCDERVFRLVDHVSGFLLKSRKPENLMLVNLYFELWMLVLGGEFPLIRSEADLATNLEGGFSWKKGKFVMVTKAMCSATDSQILVNCFKLTIEEFIHYAIQYPRPFCLYEASGHLWDALLDKKIHTRTTLVDCFREKGFL